MKRNRLIRTLLLTLIILALCAVVFARGTREEAEQECLGVYEQTYDDCFAMTGAGFYCNQKAWKAFDGCMILKGYPVNY